MKKIIALLLFSFLTPSLFCQKFEFEPPLLSEYYFQADSTGGLFQFIYRYNYDKLSFVKEGEKYTTKFRISIELQDSSTDAILRASEVKTIYVSTYDETVNPNLSVQGLLNIRVAKKKYLATVSLTDILSNKEMAVPKFNVDLSHPSAASFIVTLGENGKYYAANRRKTIPFSPVLYSLIYAPGKQIVGKDSLSLDFHSPTDSLTLSSNKQFIHEFHLEGDSLGIYLSPISGADAKSFLFSNISQILPEGKYTVAVGGKKESFLEVKWWNKPYSLMNQDVSLKALGIIEPKSNIDSLKDGSSKFGYKRLFDFWRKYDPTPNSVYNELMAEYYSRADYAQKTFSNFAVQDGMMSDRGKIYIQFGAPTSIERTTEISGRNIEVWFYEKQNSKYYFRDISGNGTYVLIKE